MNGRRLWANFNSDPKKEAQPEGPGKPTSSVFIGNLPVSTTEDDLREHFGGHGMIQSLQVGT